MGGLVVLSVVAFGLARPAAADEDILAGPEAKAAREYKIKPADEALLDEVQRIA